MSKPKILLICDVKTWGGWERAEKIAHYLSDDFKFDLMDQEEFAKFEKKSDPYFISMDEARMIVRKQQMFFTKNQICIPELLKYKKKQNVMKRDYDLYYLMFHTMLCSQEVKRMVYGGCKFISAITGLPVIKEVFANEKYAPTPRAAFDYLAKASAGFVVNNMIAYRELGEIYKGPRYYTPRGVDPDLFYPMDDYEEKWKRKPFKAIFVGKKDSGKNIKFIRNVCQEAGVVLLENQRNYTDALTKDQMRAFYNEGHVLIVASTTDGTPNPALEAAACGIPVMANRIGNMPEFLKDGYNGYFIDKPNAAAQYTEYHTKLKYLRLHPEKAKKMGENARKSILDGWTWEQQMEHERKALKGFLEK